jgi:hypothetical protein
MRDIDSDRRDEVVGVWWKNVSWSCHGCISHVPAEDKHSCGAVILPPGQSTVGEQTWLELAAPFGYERLYSLAHPASFPMADLDGDGLDEVVYSFRYTVNEPGHVTSHHSEVQVRSLSTGGSDWCRSYPQDPFGPFTCIVYPLDGDGLPDLLISERVNWGTTQGTLLGVQGATGDSLFAIPFRAVAPTVTPAYAVPGENPNVVEARTPWLYRWRLDLATNVTEGQIVARPASVELEPNAPNPFNLTTSLAFELTEADRVRLEVFNALGQRVATLADRRFPAGRHEVQWNARGVASGVYFYRLRAGTHTQTRSMMLLK